MLQFFCEIGIGYVDEFVFLYFAFVKPSWTQHNTQDLSSVIHLLAMLSVLTQVVMQSGPNLVLDAYYKLRTFHQEVDAFAICRG